MRQEGRARDGWRGTSLALIRVPTASNDLTSTCGIGNLETNSTEKKNGAGLIGGMLQHISIMFGDTSDPASGQVWCRKSPTNHRRFEQRVLYHPRVEISFKQDFDGSATNPGDGQGKFISSIHSLEQKR